MPSIVIVGSGFGGLGLAIQLRRRGMHDVVLLERGHDVGGTWRDNTYPGCACDVPSQLYAFSFAPNPDWTRRFAPQPEIQRYLRRVAEAEGILPQVRVGHDVRGAAWDEATQRWRVHTSRGTVEGDVLVLAAGALSDPVTPALPGLDRFAGRVFRSARWDHDAPLDGARVAVIGTGASAIQFVPALQPRVARLHLFQRTPPWVLPRHDRAVPPALRALYRRVPAVQRAVRFGIWASRELFLRPPFRHPRLGALAERVGRRHLARQVRDPALRDALTPRYAAGCKRVLLSDDYYPAVAQPNVELITSGVREVRARGIVAGDGVERPVDAIVFGTGFQPTTPPLAPHVRGRDGRSLAEAWGGSPRAHVGTTVPGFPNCVLLMGPNTGLGHSSVVLMLEAQIAHVLGLLDAMAARGATAVEPRAETERAWVARVDARMRGTVWTRGGCASWYLDATGRNSTLWPDGTWSFRRRVARVRVDEYAFGTAREDRREEGPGSTPRLAAVGVG